MSDDRNAVNHCVNAIEALTERIAILEERRSEMSINAGSVTIEDGRKDGGPNDYVPTRKVSVTLTFTVGEGELPEAALSAASNIAAVKVNQLLGRVVSESPKTELKVLAGETKKIEPPLAVAPVAANPAGEVKVPVKEDKPAPLGMVPQETPKPVAAVEVPKGLTDADVMAAVVATNQAIKNAPKITALVKKHTAELPVERQTVSNIPVANRQAFLDELELLKVTAPATA